MNGNCVNPYCPDPKGLMRLPTDEEVSRFRDELFNQPLDNELRQKLLTKLDKKQVTIQICTICGTWVAETWDSQRKAVVRQLMTSPFKFNVEDQVKVLLEGKHCGMVGTVTRRTRLSKTIMPPPPPENIYYLVFKGDSQEYGYSEANLAPP